MSRCAPVPVRSPAGGIRARRARVVAASLAAALVVGGGGAAASAAPARTAATTASPAAVANATPTRPVAGPTAIPSTCRAAMTVVRSDTTLAMGVVQGRKGTLYSTGHKLGYNPKAVAYLGTTTNRGVSIDRFFAVDASGRMHRIAVTERTRPGGKTVSVSDQVVARGWGSIRLMVASGPYLYGVTTAGGLRRYAISPSYGLSGAGTIATSGWGTVKSLAYGGWWRTPDGIAEDIVALTSSGAVKAYIIPRKAPKALTQRTLLAKGWGMFDHVAAGECTTGRGRTIAAVKPNGEVYAYLDVNGNDQSGKDIRWSGRVATGWTGLVTD